MAAMEFLKFIISPEIYCPLTRHAPILRQYLYMRKKEFWILTIKCGNKHEYEGPIPLSPSASFSCLSLYHAYLLVKIQNSFFFMHVLKKDVLLL